MARKLRQKTTKSVYTPHILTNILVYLLNVQRYNTIEMKLGFILKYSLCYLYSHKYFVL